jgi:membrane protein implicated in regulation of membrane protease activity
MTMDVLELIYLVCFFLGFGFAVVSALLSGVFDGAGHAAPDLGSGHAPGLGHGGTHGEVQFSPLSPVVLAMFIATFGGSGLLFHRYLHWPAAAHIPLATVSGFVAAGVVFLFFYHVFRAAQSSSEAGAEEAVGQEAEITVAIPNHGLGEIAYTVRGTRYTNPAQSRDGKELPAHLPVRILSRNGNTYVVDRIQP